MVNKADKRSTFPLLWVVFFIHGMAPGFWIPSLTNILKAEGLGAWVAWAFAIPPVCSLFAPLIVGALADERIAAQKLLAFSSLLGAVILAVTFLFLDIGLSPIWFLSGLAVYSLVSSPSWGLITTISLTHLHDGERNFPLVRVGATFGWMAAGFLTSYVLQADATPVAGYAAACARLLTGLLAFALPNTPPLGSGKSWRKALGLGAFGLFRNRNHAVLLIVTGLFSIPLAAFYMYSAELFQSLGNKAPTASVSMAQWSEVVAMFLLGTMMVKYRLKTLLMWGLGLSVLRFSMSGYAGLSGVIGWHFAGVALHGVCYTIYFVTAQVYLNRRVDPSLRAQAQGLLSLMSAGIGPLVGAFFCGWLHGVCVDSNGDGWQVFWWILAGIIGVCWIAFGALYKSMRAGH